MTDVSRGGESVVIDFKDLLLLHESQWEVEEWRKIREAVLRDIDIAIKNGVNLAGSPFPLDPWVLTYNPKFDKYDICLVDIGGYVNMYSLSEASTQILQRGREKIIEALDKLESKIIKKK